VNSSGTTNPDTLSFAQALADEARTHAGRVQLVYRGEGLPLADLDQLSRRAATLFAGLGIEKGDRVALWMPTGIDWLVAFFGLARLGAICVATNTRFRGLELSDIFGRAEVKAVVWWPGYRGIDFPELLAEAQPQLPQLRHVITYGGQTGKAPAALTETAWAELATELEYADDHGAATLPCILFTTSGTTRNSTSRGATSRSLVRHGREVGVAMGFAKPGAAALNALPLAGTFGFTHAMACLMSGTRMVLADAFEPAEAARLMAAHGVNVSAMTYEMIVRIFAATDVPVPFPGLDLFTGSHADRMVGLAAERGFRMIGVYGSSEVHALFSRRDAGDDPVRRALGGGRPVCAATRVRATDLDSGAVLPCDQPGQLEISGPTVTLGYYHDADATARAFTSDGWFRTGDLGSVGADGSVLYLARLGDSLRLRGFLVSPFEIEAFIAEQPGVELAQVVGADGPDGLPCAVCFYKVKPGARVDGAVLRAACAAGMASYKVPLRCIEVDSFPVGNSPNAVKIDRIELRRRAAALFAHAAAQPAQGAPLAAPDTPDLNVTAASTAASGNQ